MLSNSVILVLGTKNRNSPPHSALETVKVWLISEKLLYFSNFCLFFSRLATHIYRIALKIELLGKIFLYLVWDVKFYKEDQIFELT